MFIVVAGSVDAGAYQFALVVGLILINIQPLTEGRNLRSSKFNQFHIVSQLVSDTGTADLEIWYSVHRDASLSL
jgi:hypothetical protein